MHALNEAQIRAVEEGDGPVLVLAGAGTGKTRVIIERLAWLVSEKGVDPRYLLALTFTNRAANEMKARAAERLGLGRIAAWVGTFHAFGLYVLRREIEHLGRGGGFTVFDDADQLSLMKRLIKELPPAFERVSPREALNWISGLKQQLEAPKPEDAAAREDEALHRLWTQYHEALHNANAVDFDDLLVLPVKVFKAHPPSLERYQRRYRYVHVDEYQDTNHAQFVLAKLLSEGHGNLFAVGDEDQSIYSWRGADINNVLQFQETFPDARVLRLEQNYRSTKAILKAANAVVSNNVFRLGKTLWTDLDAGDPVRLYEAENDADEADFITADAALRNLPLHETAVLYRTNGQARVLEEALRKARTPYRVYGGIQFYSRKEVKDLLAYLRLVASPADDVSLRRILNVPPRGIGATTLEHLNSYARERNAGLMQVLRDVETDQTLNPRARKAIAAFVHLIDDLALAAKTQGPGALVKRIMDETGYRKYVEESDEKDFRARLEIVDEFASSCAQYDREHEGGADLLTFLQDLALVSDVDNLEPDAPSLTLMTCHSAKGLEFGHVYLVGLEEGLLPHASSQDSEEEIEEERRLCYVAMTRARQTLTLAYARRRVMYGESRPSEPSRFLGEIPEGSLDLAGQEAGAAPSRGRKGAAASAAPTEDIDVARIKMGTRVRHATFGDGTVMYTAGAGKKLRARIRFQTGRTREFMVSKAPLEIVEGKGR